MMIDSDVDVVENFAIIPLTSAWAQLSDCNPRRRGIERMQISLAACVLDALGGMSGEPLGGLAPMNRSSEPDR